MNCPGGGLRTMHTCLGACALALAMSLVGCEQDNPAESLPDAARTALYDGENLELLTLDPNPRSEKTDGVFHGYNILGKAAIDDTETRDKLLRAFSRGVSENEAEKAGCFDPRHGIRVVYAGKTYDFVVCFQCLQARWYVDAQKQETMLLSDSPRDVFNEVAKNHKLPWVEHWDVIYPDANTPTTRTEDEQPTD